MNEKRVVITYDVLLKIWRVECWLSETKPRPELSFKLVDYFDAVNIAKNFLEDDYD